MGDFVELQLEQDDIAWITKIEPRKNYLIRKSVNLSKEAHIIASNLDLACIIFTLQSPNTSLGYPAIPKFRDEEYERKAGLTLKVA